MVGNHEKRTQCIRLLIPGSSDPEYFNKFYGTLLPWDVPLGRDIFVLAHVDYLDTIYVEDRRGKFSHTYKYKANPDMVLQYIRQIGSPGPVVTLGRLEWLTAIRCDALIDCISDPTPLIPLAHKIGLIDKWFEYLALNVTDVPFLVELAKRCGSIRIYVCIRILLPLVSDPAPLIDLAHESHSSYIHECIQILLPHVSDPTPLIDLARKSDRIHECIRILQPRVKNIAFLLRT